MRRALVRALRTRNVDAVTALDMGMIEQADEDHLAAATAQRRVLYSFNLADFYRLHRAWLAAGKSHSGMVLAQQQRYSVGEQMRRLLKLIASKSAEDMQNQAEFLSYWG